MQKGPLVPEYAKQHQHQVTLIGSQIFLALKPYTHQTISIHIEINLEESAWPITTRLITNLFLYSSSEVCLGQMKQQSHPQHVLQ